MCVGVFISLISAFVDDDRLEIGPDGLLTSLALMMVMMMMMIRRRMKGVGQGRMLL